MCFSLRLSLAAVICLGSFGPGRAQEDPKAIIEKAIKARGGEEKFAKLTARQIKGKGIIHLDGGISAAIKHESRLQLPDKLRSDFQVDAPGQKVSIAEAISGDKGWTSIGGDVKEMLATGVTEFSNAIYAAKVEDLVPLLREKQFTLAALPNSKINDKTAAVVRVTSKDKPDIKLFFDKESGLLVKSERETFDQSEKKVLGEHFYSAFRDFDGVKNAGKILIKQNGKDFMELEITEVKYLERIEDSVFAKP